MWTGTWSLGMVSLKILYDEHKVFRNRWSSSNCGFDLVEYRGTTVYLEQHSTIDYIAFFDEEYTSITSFSQQASLHPLILITHPKTIIIKSRARAGPRRARKVFLPRPSWWDSGWSISKEVATKGLFVWYISAINLEHPWLDNFFSDDNQFKDHFWWKSTGMEWKTKYDEYVKLAVNSINAEGGKRTINDWVSKGPMMLYPTDLTNDRLNYQFTWFYKSYWVFGGNNISLKSACDPTKDIPIAP